MNKELIRKALNEGTLRPANLSDLPVGVKVVAGSGYQGEVLAHHADKVVFGWEHGQVNSFNYEEPHQIYLAPLCFVEGRPVYKGDILYSKHGRINERVISHAEVLDNPERFRLVTVCGLWEPPENLSWTKPVTTININGHEVPMPEREAPEEGTGYFFPANQYQGGTGNYTWDNDVTDNRLLAAGMVHLTEGAARKHAEALASFTRKQ
jgi:hypothetical protein